MNMRRLLFFALALGSLPSGACSCDEDPLTARMPGTCEPDYECPQGFDYRRGECRASRCQIDDDCCPGQKCNEAAGFCADQYVSCTADSECTEVPGQTCIAFRGAMFCGYPNRGNGQSESGTQLCLTKGDCDEGRTCFGGRCVVFAPCMGGCPEGQVCDVDSNTCFNLPTCTETCMTGSMLVVADPDHSTGPNCCLVECLCAVLPPVQSGQFGWYASLALVADGAAVASYDPIYGDLVVAQFDGMGVRTAIDYVDGYPIDGPVVANPEGPRGGRDQPGPNVGEHASMAIDATGTLHVAYYDRTESRLKYANNSGGLWKSSVVDDDGNVGLYTSIAIGPDQNPHIAYMLAEGTIAPDPMKRTALKYASAHTSLPMSNADWTVEVIDSQLLPEPICSGMCPTDQSCVDRGTGPECVPNNAGCTTCGTGQACIDDGMGMGMCIDKVPLIGIDDLIEGTGLFASLAFTSDGRAMIAYYDRIAGDVKLASSDLAGTFTSTTIDGNDPMNPTDVGQHVSLAIAPGDIPALAYVDATHDDLVYMEARPGFVREIVDNGVSPPDLRLVGPDASLIFDQNGNAAISYQDPTNLDLLYARRMGNPAIWSTEVLRGMNMASGFYTSQKRADQKAFIANVDVTFDTEGNLILQLMVMVKELL